ncbi:2-keto-4-pentenoate hydratase/2-oxohepta-3-ene-1,7-dioic acid hydratase (catechol pathway) [Chitinophaga rupis]|jgi:2-keto-4-pentenoate hydratase/2-oxohepta-3-ene-1,7-dioic acid hydratase in catechol pathway|uniref:2-keto-4-pentenoate hydratase/2-oxohepta-3-ene-1,7-dioic acid hydratase (Catechol pathway) n=1 Tax=Chitinophaga rupis TaxID=573321 RepID=A0A1H8CSL4_9BACT|nr:MULTISPECIES: fumarylacetoacetate hydrolase family protein [Chitinophaga]SEM97862.1 2-keto-4-pentenoate hydratase/2-oxohepta-3-ene-1,7-dioic acid hydratase (catechol pathway) [Chitinophaga rupis]
MKIICVGRNYAEHAKELNNEVPTEPVLFMKPKNALLQNNHPFYYPDFTDNLHYECELVLRVCKNGKHIQEKFADKYYNEISVGIDFTARDLQDKQKTKGLPWEIAKSFDNSAVVGKFIPLTPETDKKDINFCLYKNKEIVQQGNTKHLIFTFDFLLAYISKFFTLNIGDLIFTGTPVGVGPVEIGDNLEAFIENDSLLEFMVK